MKKKFKDLTLGELYKTCRQHGFQYIKCHDCKFYKFCYDKRHELREFVAPIDWKEVGIWYDEIEVD